MDLSKINEMPQFEFIKNQPFMFFYKKFIINTKYNFKLYFFTNKIKPFNSNNNHQNSHEAIQFIQVFHQMTKSDIFLSSSDDMYWSRVGSFFSTSFLISFDAHFLYACLQTSLMFLPEKPSVSSAKNYNSLSLICFA